MCVSLLSYYNSATLYAYTRSAVCKSTCDVYCTWLFWAQDLKTGRNQLKQEVKESECAPVAFMQDNLDAFLLCYQTLSDILPASYIIILYA